MAAKNETAQPELVITRVLDAPRALVFKAWTDPEHLAQWWGPHGFTNPVCEWDVRPGGAIRVHMRGPDGTVYPMTGVYNEIVEPERLSLVCAALDQNGNPLLEVQTTAIFEDLGGKTEVTLQARVLNVTGDGAQHLAGMNEGWSQSLERLAETVDTLAGSSSDREIVTTRLIDTPRELVYKAWIDPVHLAKWWGPNGFTNTFHEFDLRPGGNWRFVMHGPNGVDYQNHSVFAEIRKPERIVFDHVSAPKFRAIFTFAEIAGKTKLTFRQVFETAAKCDKVKAYAGDANEENLNRLEAELAVMG